MPSICFVRSAAICAAVVPSGAILKSSALQPWRRASSWASQWVSEPWLEMLTVLPLRSAMVLMPLSLRTASSTE